jgi:hypothetical protein
VAPGRPVAVLLAVSAGAVAGGVSYVLGSTDPGLTAAVAVSYAVAAGLTARHPDTVHEEGVAVWEFGRWSGASTALVLAAALFGVGPTLPVDPDLRLSLQVLVVGVGYAMWLLGVAYARAKSGAARRDERGESAADHRTDG